jgi:hypothetical protein
MNEKLAVHNNWGWEQLELLELNAGSGTASETISLF